MIVRRPTVLTRLICLSLLIAIFFSLIESPQKLEFSPRVLDKYASRYLNDTSICDRGQYPSEDSLIEDKVTILVNGFAEARLGILRQISYQYSLSPSVDAIYILWGNVSSPADVVEANWTSGGAPVAVYRQKTDSLNDRFLPRKFVRTKSVLICDDDISVNESSLAFALRIWMENPHRIVGFFPRAHEYIAEKDEWIYRKFPDRYSVMLTKLMILHTEYLYKYTCTMPAGVKEYVDANMNCEDIAMNFLVSMETKVGPLLVSGAPQDWGDTRNSDDNLSSVGISARSGHKQERGVCLANFKTLFGGMQLRFSYGKAFPDVSEVVLCNKHGVMVHCDSKAKTQYDAQRAVGQHLVNVPQRYAYVTLIGSVEYIRPALILAQCLRSSATVHDMVLMVDTSGGLDLKNTTLDAHYSRVVKVKPVKNRYNIKGFNKLNAWLLEEYTKVVYLDVDTMVLTNLDHLFDHPEPTAVPDVYMSEKFNSGVLVIKPSKKTFVDLISKIDYLPSYNKGDQGFLNAYFSGWFQMPAAHRLPVRYNGVFLFPPHYNPPDWFNMNRSYEVMGPLAVVHFAGPWHKPWRLNTTSSEIIWCDIWLKIAAALEQNGWLPLNPDQLAIRELLPNPQDYDPYPNATVLPVPLWFKADNTTLHRQFLQNKTKGHSEAFVTVVYDNATVYGAAVWALSFRKHHVLSPNRRTVLLVSSRLHPSVWRPLKHLFSVIKVVDPIKVDGKRYPNKFLVLHVWALKKGFDKLVYINPLAFFHDNCFDLFSYEPFAAVPSVFPSDMFTIGVLVIQPNKLMFKDMKSKLAMLEYPEGMFDRFLNAYFFDWFMQSAEHRLPTKYGVDMWFKEGLMKFFTPWKILHFDHRAPPWANISEWTANDRILVAESWRKELCSFDAFPTLKSSFSCKKVDESMDQIKKESTLIFGHWPI